MRYCEAPAAAKTRLVGKGKGMAVEATKVPVPHFLNTARNPVNLARPNLLSKYASPALRASWKVIYAPMVDPAVATATYSYHGLGRVVTRIARRIAGPPKVGTGQLSRIARKKSPRAPRCRNTERNERPRPVFWRITFNADHRRNPVLSFFRRGEPHLHV